MQSGLSRHLSEQLEGLRAAVLEAGLAGQVQIGVPTRTPPPAEEGVSPLHSLLGLAARPSRGQLIELTGCPSSGRTALAYQLAREATTRGELAGWVDLPDSLDPRGLRRAGVRLESLLWVRPRRVQAALRATELLLHTGFALVVIDLEGAARHTLSRLGAAAWARLLRVTRESRATAVLLGGERAPGSFATLALYTERRQALFEEGLFEGIETRAAVLRNRTGPAGTEYSFQTLFRPSGKR